ncbi:hypothetical protein BU17DRAFT_70508 [Hysterangium stoloniferum]|nr:hypothetical protein BU17DRAFT_70508 [Hysterangium stoloniferum]
MAGWAALSRRIPKLKRRVKPPFTNTILETTGNRLKAARENWTLLDSRTSDTELLDSKTLPQELQTMYNELMPFVTDVKAKAVDGKLSNRQDKSIVFVWYFSTFTDGSGPVIDSNNGLALDRGNSGKAARGRQWSELRLCMCGKAARITSSEKNLTSLKKRLHDQLVSMNQLQHLQDQAEQSRQLQLSGDAINRIEVVLKFTLFSIHCTQRVFWSGNRVKGIRSLKLAAAVMPLEKLSKNGSASWRYGMERAFQPSGICFLWLKPNVISPRKYPEKKCSGSLGGNTYVVREVKLHFECSKQISKEDKFKQLTATQTPILPGQNPNRHAALPLSDLAKFQWLMLGSFIDRCKNSWLYGFMGDLRKDLRLE